MGTLQLISTMFTDIILLLNVMKYIDHFHGFVTTLLWHIYGRIINDLGEGGCGTHFQVKLMGTLTIKHIFPLPTPSPKNNEENYWFTPYPFMMALKLTFVSDVFQVVKEKYGKVDICVCNAGILNENNFKMTLDVNLVSHVSLI